MDEEKAHFVIGVASKIRAEISRNEEEKSTKVIVVARTKTRDADQFLKANFSA